MGYCKDLAVILMETGMEEFCWSGREGKPIKWEDCEKTYLASYEAYQEELADRTAGAVDKTPVVKAKIARIVELGKIREARKARIAELRAKFPGRPVL